MFCEYCGTAMNQGMQFCGRCGRQARIAPAQQEYLLYTTEDVRITTMSATLAGKVVPLAQIVGVEGVKGLSRGAYNAMAGTAIGIQAVSVVGIPVLLFSVPMTIMANATWKDRYVIDLELRDTRRSHKRRFMLLGNTLVMQQTQQALLSAVQQYRT
jgi:hypothetical protein